MEEEGGGGKGGGGGGAEKDCSKGFGSRSKSDLVGLTEGRR